MRLGILHDARVPSGASPYLETVVTTTVFETVRYVHCCTDGSSDKLRHHSEAFRSNTRQEATSAECH